MKSSKLLLGLALVVGTPGRADWSTWRLDRIYQKFTNLTTSQQVGVAAIAAIAVGVAGWAVYKRLTQSPSNSAPAVGPKNIDPKENQNLAVAASSDAVNEPIQAQQAPSSAAAGAGNVLEIQTACQVEVAVTAVLPDGHLVSQRAGQITAEIQNPTGKGVALVSEASEELFMARLIINTIKQNDVLFKQVAQDRTYRNDLFTAVVGLKPEETGATEVALWAQGLERSGLKIVNGRAACVRLARNPDIQAVLVKYGIDFEKFGMVLQRELKRSLQNDDEPCFYRVAVSPRK